MFRAFRKSWIMEITASSKRLNTRLVACFVGLIKPFFETDLLKQTSKYLCQLWTNQLSEQTVLTFQANVIRQLSLEAGEERDATGRQLQEQVATVKEVAKACDAKRSK